MNIEKLTLRHQVASQRWQATPHLCLRPAIAKITNVHHRCQGVQVKGMPEVSDTAEPGEIRLIICVTPE